ncbi:MAG: hypothetical protein II410_02540 [Ruminococcus sp.]|nr:hypothetical protein [Ruminococcus sp.]
MLAKKFDLGMYHLGNGTTVCNRAVKEHGDYKYIAHISAAGNIKFYVPEDYIPPEDMARIRSCADSDKAKFRADFEKMGKYEQYEKILDSLNHADFLKVTADKRPFDERLPELREYYYSIA